MKRKHKILIVVVVVVVGAWFVWSKIKQTGNDLGSAANNTFVNPLKTLFP